MPPSEDGCSIPFFFESKLNLVTPKESSEERGGKTSFYDERVWTATAPLGPADVTIEILLWRHLVSLPFSHPFLITSAVFEHDLHIGFK